MSNFEDLKHKARHFAAQSTDIEGLSKAAEVLKSVAEAEKASVDALNGRRYWTSKVGALTPMFAAIITGLTFGITFLYQRKQSDIAAQQVEETQWRAALQKVGGNDSVSSQAAAFAMQSFFDSTYTQQSRTIAAFLAPNIRDTGAFDFMFFELAKRTGQQNQGELIDIARALSTREQKAYASLPETVRRDHPFEQLLVDPADVLLDQEDPKFSEKLQDAEADGWELDTVSVVLSRIWKGPLPLIPSDQRAWKGPTRLDPSELDLRGIVFLNGDFTGIDNLSKARMDAHTGFYGRCMVDNVIRSRIEDDGVVVKCRPQ